MRYLPTEKHGKIYWWLWFHLTKDGRELHQMIETGVDFEYDEEDTRGGG